MSWVFPNAVPVVCLASIDPHSVMFQTAVKTKIGWLRT